MNQKHVRARIDQCLRNAELSRCPRRKFGALILDPKTNSIVADGYNGPPRGENGLCRGWFCERDGIAPDRLRITNGEEVLRYDDENGHTVRLQYVEDLRRALSPQTSGPPPFNNRSCTSKEELVALRESLLAEYPPIPSGTSLERGCHHAEANALANAAARGAPTRGTWLIVTGEPCLMCAKFIHHAGVERVYVVRGGYAGGDDGPKYLCRHQVEVKYVDGPQDPRGLS